MLASTNPSAGRGSRRFEGQRSRSCTAMLIRTSALGQPVFLPGAAPGDRTAASAPAPTGEVAVAETHVSATATTPRHQGPDRRPEPVSEINVAQPPLSEGCETVPAWDICLA